MFCANNEILKFKCVVKMDQQPYIKETKCRTYVVRMQVFTLPKGILFQVLQQHRCVNPKSSKNLFYMNFLILKILPTCNVARRIAEWCCNFGQSGNPYDQIVGNVNN